MIRKLVLESSRSLPLSYLLSFTPVRKLVTLYILVEFQPSVIVSDMETDPSEEELLTQITEIELAIPLVQASANNVQAMKAFATMNLEKAEALLTVRSIKNDDTSSL
jgi:hypothetical protein